jgi:long-chain fatty acid transport protein
MKKLLLSGIATALLFAGGYKIPEQSIKGMALSAANVANANGADSAYYNPANMVFNEDKNYLQLLMTYIHLNKIEFKNSNGEIYYSRKENFILPQLHYASKDFNGWRFGFSITYPGGLSKRWDDIIPQAGAKEFTLKTIEFNPVVAKKVSKNIGIAFGFRIVKSEGIANALGLQNNGSTVTPLYSQYLNGDSVDYGWNMAIAIQNDSRDTKFAITYRSKVKLKLSGTSSGFYLTDLILKYAPTLPLPPHKYISFNTPGRVTVPLPATLNVAIAKTIKNTTFEFVFDRTYWSSYKNLDFDFDNPIVDKIFGNPKPKKWKNSNSYRFGITHKCTNKLTAMLAYAYDETPIPNSTIDFSLPDNDKHIFSGGIIYKLTNNMKIGFSALYAQQKSRKAKIYDPITNSYISGEFKKGGAFLMGAGFEYSF